jgi:hypothetical protein
VSITVSPDTFKFVTFDAATIVRVAEGLVGALGLSGNDVSIVVDETTPLAKITYELAEHTITVHADSGAFEDTRKPRQLSEHSTATALGRVLLKARDRLSGGFGEAPADDQLSLAQIAAWDTYAIGRLERVGVAANQQRWRYNFRNRHGFTDASDAAFDQLWASDGLTWGELLAVTDSLHPAGR